MIVGLGSDLADIRRIEATLERFGERFVARIFTDVERARSGQPTLALTGGAAKRLAAITPAGFHPRIHLSLTDDHPYAQAFVVIEALAPHEHELTGQTLAGAVSSV